MANDGEQQKAEGLANKLGWFSLGLGAVELIAPGKLAEVIGLPPTDKHPVMQAYGAREIAAGVGILARPGETKPGAWILGRVAGDVLDLASLGCAFFAEDSDKLRLSLATAVVVGVTAADIYCAKALSAELPATLVTKLAGGKPIELTKTVTIGKPAPELYTFWRDFSKLPEILPHLESVGVTDATHSHWKAKGPAGSAPEWDAEITEDQPNERIAWRSLGGDIRHSGSVEFRPATANRGTVVTVKMLYEPPGGALGAKVAKLFGNEPGQEVATSLRAFKQVMETGEVVHSDASIHSGMYPAQPPAEEALAV